MNIVFHTYNPRSLSLRSYIERIIRVPVTTLLSETESLVVVVAMRFLRENNDRKWSSDAIAALGRP